MVKMTHQSFARQSDGPTFELERGVLSGQSGLVAGVDEVGRGPLAGPVVAAAVILRPTRAHAGIDDSKKLSARRRESLFENIVASAIAVGVGVASVDEIETINIREANLLAMRRALDALAIAPMHALIDGNAIPRGLRCGASAIVAGDGKSLSIAAASIVAKVIRDRMMTRLDQRFPHYGFARNAGYGTAAHLAALEAHGPCPLHRRGFAPVRALIARGR